MPWDDSDLWYRTPPNLRLGDPRFNAMINSPTNDARTTSPYGALSGFDDLGRMVFGPRRLEDTTRDVNRYIANDPTMTPEERRELVSGFLGMGNITRNLTRIPNPIRAYHVSPFEYETPSLIHIGRGEGSQAYGHGLYGAGNVAVRDEYYRALQSHPHVLATGRGPFRYDWNLHARPEQFLDWDNPLRGPGRDVLEPFLREARLGRWRGVSNAGDLSRALAQEEIRGPNASRITEALSNAGIPGLRYLDAGSRAGGTGTSNYVVWSPEIIEIMRRYGLIPPVVGATGAAGLMDRQQ